jgi:N-succinyldiaminopimelate aminotransferase
LNSNLSLLQPYPFERLRALTQAISPNSALAAINLSIGEPRHPTPGLLRDALIAGLGGLSNYPATIGSRELRETIAKWLTHRFQLGEQPDPDQQVLPVNGSREALFAFAQVVVDAGAQGHRPLVICPNPFYQIYEGAALLAGATPWFINQRAENHFRCDFRSIPSDVLARCQLMYVCSPGNPTGGVLSVDEWKTLFDLSDEYGFVIAADECYSEIYFDENRPPCGALQAAWRLGRRDYRRLMVFSSLSKRSNAPGLRSGFVAGDAALIRDFRLYRTYHGGAMSPPVQSASVAAWRDEAHVIENRRQYRAKFDAVTPLVADKVAVQRPEAGFFLWMPVPDGDDLGFCQDLLRHYNVQVLPGSFLARQHAGENPGQGFVRLALVEPLSACVEAAHRIRALLSASGA